MTIPLFSPPHVTPIWRFNIPYPPLGCQMTVPENIFKEVLFVSKVNLQLSVFRHLIFRLVSNFYFTKFFRIFLLSFVALIRTIKSSSFGPILLIDTKFCCLKPVHSVIIENRQTKCPIWRVVQGTGSLYVIDRLLLCSASAVCRRHQAFARF